MIKMTFEQYDSMCEKFEKTKKKQKSSAIIHWPSVEDVDLMKKDPDRWIKYACYLEETNPPPSNKEEEYSQKNLRLFINQNLELV